MRLIESNVCVSILGGNLHNGWGEGCRDRHIGKVSDHISHSSAVNVCAIIGNCECVCVCARERGEREYGVRMQA